MGSLTQSAKLNLALISDDLYTEVKHNQLFAHAFGEIKETTIDAENGQKEYTPSGAIIESFEGFKEQGRDNMILTMDEDLVGDPIYGDTPRSGTGKKLPLRSVMAVENWMNSVKAEMPIPSLAANHFAEGVETTGGKMVCLNNQLERPASFN